MECNYCKSKKADKVTAFHYAGFLCDKCKGDLRGEIEEVAWKYFKIKRKKGDSEIK